MTAALALAEQGFETHLIEKSNRLGGNFLDLNYTLEHEDVGGFLTPWSTVSGIMTISSCT